MAASRLSSLLLVGNLEVLGLGRNVLDTVDGLVVAALGLADGHLDLAVLGLGDLDVGVVVAALGLPEETLDPARDLLLALTGEDGLGERVAVRSVLLLWQVSVGGQMGKGKRDVGVWSVRSRMGEVALPYSSLVQVLGH